MASYVDELRERLASLPDLSSTDAVLEWAAREPAGWDVSGVLAARDALSDARSKRSKSHAERRSIKELAAALQSAAESVLGDVQARRSRVLAQMQAVKEAEAQRASQLDMIRRVRGPKPPEKATPSRNYQPNPAKREAPRWL